MRANQNAVVPEDDRVGDDAVDKYSDLERK